MCVIVNDGFVGGFRNLNRCWKNDQQEQRQLFWPTAAQFQNKFSGGASSVQVNCRFLYQKKSRLKPQSDEEKGLRGLQLQSYKFDK